MRRLLVALVGLPGLLAAQATRCPAPDSLAPWARVLRAWKSESGQTWTNDSLRRVLLALVEADQAARRDFGARAADTTFMRQLMRDDSARARTMGNILDRHGLPTRSMVGAAGADAAMLIVQHNAPLQRRVLAMALRLPESELSPEALAMLSDRVAVSEGKPQRYGTQFTMGADTLFRFAPTEDLPGLEARRARAGLPPLPDYVCWLEEMGMRVEGRSFPIR